MTRDDERRQTKGGLGASMARDPEAARRDEEPHVTAHVSREHDDPEHEHEGEDSSMARSKGAAHRGAEEHEHEERAIEGKRGSDEVKGGRGIEREHVDADHVIGTGGAVGVKSAEGETDMASAKANRKEADEPEREASEQVAMGRERTPPTKNTMGWGERETVAKHTI